MKKIVIANNKGGVAKTTSAFNIISYFAKNGLKVLAIEDRKASCRERVCQYV